MSLKLNSLLKSKKLRHTRNSADTDHKQFLNILTKGPAETAKEELVKPLNEAVEPIEEKESCLSKGSLLKKKRQLGHSRIKSIQW